MQQFLLLLLAVVLSSPLTLTAEKPQAIRLCVGLLANRSHSTVSPEWQQKQLIRALERTNKMKEVKNGTTAEVKPVALDSNTEQQGCSFVLNTELVDVQRGGSPRVGTGPPGAIETGVTIGKIDEPPEYRRELHDATVNYRIVRDGNPESWASGIVTAKDTVSEDALVSRLMDQIASRAAHELRNPHLSTPE